MAILGKKKGERTKDSRYLQHQITRNNIKIQI